MFTAKKTLLATVSAFALTLQMCAPSPLSAADKLYDDEERKESDMPTHSTPPLSMGHLSEGQGVAEAENRNAASRVLETQDAYEDGMLGGFLFNDPIFSRLSRATYQYTQQRALRKLEELGVKKRGNFDPTLNPANRLRALEASVAATSRLMHLLAPHIRPPAGPAWDRPLPPVPPLLQNDEVGMTLVKRAGLLGDNTSFRLWIEALGEKEGKEHARDVVEDLIQRNSKSALHFKLADLLLYNDSDKVIYDATQEEAQAFVEARIAAGDKEAIEVKAHGLCLGNAIYSRSRNLFRDFYRTTYETVFLNRITEEKNTQMYLQVPNIRIHMQVPHLKSPLFVDDDPQECARLTTVLSEIGHQSALAARLSGLISTSGGNGYLPDGNEFMRLATTFILERSIPWYSAEEKMYASNQLDMFLRSPGDVDPALFEEFKRKAATYQEALGDTIEIYKKRSYARHTHPDEYARLTNLLIERGDEEVIYDRLHDLHSEANYSPPSENEFMRISQAFFLESNTPWGERKIGYKLKVLDLIDNFLWGCSRPLGNPVLLKSYTDKMAELGIRSAQQRQIYGWFHGRLNHQSTQEKSLEKALELVQKYRMDTSVLGYLTQLGI